MSPFRAAASPLDRRTFLRGAGVSLALPFLDAMRPAVGAAVALTCAASTAWALRTYATMAP
jgi:hypothetical protein